MVSAEREKTDKETLSDMNRMIVLNTGRVFVSAENSVWMVDHSNFSSSCEGQVTIVAQAKNGTYKSTGDYCSGCQANVGLDMSIEREDLAKKVREDREMEAIKDSLGLNGNPQDLTETR